MKPFFSLFLLVFAGVALSWVCLLLIGSGQLSAGKLETSLVVAGDDVVLEADLGLAARGKEVYRELGCVQCHTQQVRRPGYGGDLDRGWGSRQTVARDYVLQNVVALGNRRIGPDLADVGSRRDAEWFFQHLYDPTSLADWSISPSYAHLFYDKEVTDETSPTALKLEGNDAPEPGFERVPHFDAIALVAYLESLKLDYDLPESKRVK